VGILTDGDLRRALLHGKGLDSPVRDAMQRQFTAVGPHESRANVLDIMKSRRFKHVPIVGEQGQFLGLHLLHDLIRQDYRDNAAVILCGGKGMRLRPITESIPKPMIQVAGRPILERIILHLVGHGFRNIYLAVHYLGEMIEAHFGTGEKFGCRISYLREERPLGTGGAIALLPEHVAGPMLVMNGDLVTQFDASRMLEDHLEQGNRATLGVQTYTHEIPFGVVDGEADAVERIREKPILEFRVNAGIYILDSDIRTRLTPGEPITIPAIIQGCLDAGERVGCFHVDEDWMDVGRHDDLRTARGMA